MVDITWMQIPSVMKWVQHHAVLPRQEWQDTKKYLEANPEEARRRDGKWGWKPWHGLLPTYSMYAYIMKCVYV